MFSVSCLPTQSGNGFGGENSHTSLSNNFRTREAGSGQVQRIRLDITERMIPVDWSLAEDDVAVDGDIGGYHSSELADCLRGEFVKVVAVNDIWARW